MFSDIISRTKTLIEKAPTLVCSPFRRRSYGEINFIKVDKLKEEIAVLFGNISALHIWIGPEGPNDVTSGG